MSFRDCFSRAIGSQPYSTSIDGHPLSPLSQTHVTHCPCHVHVGAQPVPGPDQAVIQQIERTSLPCTADLGFLLTPSTATGVPDLVLCPTCMRPVLAARYAMHLEAGCMPHQPESSPPSTTTSMPASSGGAPSQVCMVRCPHRA